MDKKLGIIAVIVFFSLVGILASLILSMNSTVSPDTLPSTPNLSRNNPTNVPSRTSNMPPQRMDKDLFMQLLAFEISKEQAMYFIPVILFTALGTAAASYYIMSKRTTEDGLDKKEVRKVFLTSLTSPEKEVIELLFKNNGSVHQYELTRVSGMTKVQTHRLVERMTSKGIIIKKKIGKVNRIELADNLRILI